MFEGKKKIVRRKQNLNSSLSRRELLKRGLYGGLGIGLSSNFLVSGCSRRRRDERPNAVVILLDTVRADHVSCYGYNRPTTPAIDALAKDGVRFTQVVSQSPWTMPSLAALLSGQYMEQVVDVVDGQLKMKCSLAEVFAGAGFATAGITEGGYVSKRYDMHRGFGYWYEEEGAVRWVADGGPARSNFDATGGIAKTFSKAREWLKKHKDKPFFLFIHTYEPHTPYTNHYFSKGVNPGRIGKEFKTRYLSALRDGRLILTDAEKQYAHALYEGDIYSADRYVKGFLRFLEEIEVRSKTVVVVTSDHGEELGEHFERYIYDHGHSLKDNQLMVPLVIQDPRRKFAVGRVDAQVRLFDVMPTVADLLGVKIEYPVAGRSVVDFMTGKETSNRVAISGQTKLGPLRCSIRDGRYKFIGVIAPDDGEPVMMVPVLPKWQLYDLLNDPAEKTNLVDTMVGLAKAMSASLQQHYDKLERPAVLSRPEASDEKHLERLRSLGYVE